MNEFELHVFEMAYVMSLMGVESVAALPDAVLFPKDPALRKKVLADGEQRIVANGWAVAEEGSRKAAYNADLMSMAAAMADPRFSIITRRQTSEGERADATIFFNNVEVVEVTQRERQAFRLRRLADAPGAFQRVRKMLGVAPRPGCSNAHAELRIETFEKVRRHAAGDELSEATAELVEAGLPESVASNLSAALASPQRKGVVSILKHVAQKVTDVRVLGFYLRDGRTWLTSVVSDSSRLVRVEAVDSEGFIRRLVDRVASVCA